MLVPQNNHNINLDNRKECYGCYVKSTDACTRLN